MLTFFEPQTKIQKDRQIIRDTDMRMAKYSRRGIVSNFTIYALCLLIEQNFIRQYPNLAIIFTIGLLLTTALRGYLLFRMDAIYPRAPTAWRNKYFAATLIGATWWGLILSCLTLLMHMQGEAALMWLYTVVFFATTAHAFAPYQRFLSIYQLVVIVPAACCTFFSGGGFFGVFYGCILLFYYGILKHHCELISRNYWDRLEAHFILAKKAESLEEEKRDTIASTQLTNDYLQVLSHKMADLLSATPSVDENTPPTPVALANQRLAFETIYRNVDAFSRVIAKDVNIESRAFNIRHYVQSLVRGMVAEAEAKGIELESALSPALPARLLGDPKRIGQILSAMVKNIIEQSQGGLIFVEVEFVREFETSGLLHITIARQLENKRGVFVNESERGVAASLDLMVAKGLAEAMKGSLEINESGDKNGKHLRLRLPSTIAEKDSRQDYHRACYKGRHLMLVHPNPRWLDHKRMELDAMGFTVHTATRFGRAFQSLVEAVEAGKAMDCVVYYAASGDEQPVQFCNDLLGRADLKYIHQFIICSDVGQRFFAERMLQPSPSIHFVAKPSSIFEFEVRTYGLFRDPADDAEDKADSPPRAGRVIWMSNGKATDGPHWADPKLDIQVINDMRQIPKVLEGRGYRLVVVECAGSEDVDAIANIREQEQKHKPKSLVTIVGVGASNLELSVLNAGADHFLDIETLLTWDAHELHYWANGRSH